MKSIKNKIEKQIFSSNNFGKVWSIEDFDKYPRLCVAKALSDLYKEGKLKRIKRGYYYSFKQTVLGDTTYDKYSFAIAKTASKASFYCISGLSGFNRLGFTTQVPKTITIACDYKLRNTDFIRYVLRNKPVNGGEAERVVLDAIIDINKIPDATPNSTIKHIKQLIKQGKVNLDSLVNTAFFEKPRVKAVVGAIAEEFGFSRKILKKLKKSLNENSMIYLDIIDSLKYAESWKIQPERA